MHVTQQGDEVGIHLQTDSPNSQAILVSELPQLQAELQDKNVDLTALTVSVRDEPINPSHPLMLIPDDESSRNELPRQTVAPLNPQKFQDPEVRESPSDVGLSVSASATDEGNRGLNTLGSTRSATAVASYPEMTEQSVNVQASSDAATFPDTQEFSRSSRFVGIEKSWMPGVNQSTSVDGRPTDESHPEAARVVASSTEISNSPANVETDTNSDEILLLDLKAGPEIAKQSDKKNNQNENDKPTFEEVVSFEDEPSEGMKQRNESTNRQTMRGTKGQIRQAASWSTIQRHEDEVKKNAVMSGDFGIRLAQPKNRLSENQSESEKTIDLPNHLSSVVDESEAAKVADSSANSGQIAGQETETISESYEIHSAPPQTERKTLQEIRQQIFQSIRSRQHAITTEYKELTIRLNPAHLGKLIVRIAQKGNAVAVHVQASTHEAQQLLMSELSQLRADLQEQNIKLANLEVSVGNESAFQQSGQQHAFSSHRRRKSAQSIKTANQTAPVIRAEPTPMNSGWYVDGRLNLIA